MSTVPTTRRLKHWGWGYEDEQPAFDELRAAVSGLRARLAFAPCEPERPAALEDIELAPPRLAPPAPLHSICTSDTHARVSHAYGKAYRDLVRAFRGQIDHAPDVVARPRDEHDVENLLAWCSEARAAAIPYGGGTSVVGGVEPRLGDGYAGAVTIDMRTLDRVLDVDPVSGAALIQSGASGPRLEEQLRAHDLTLRHYPQSFEFSTLGGWIATRAGGHFATLATHIDDLVESIRALTPSGAWESRRLPGSGAGPSPDRLLLGSEGIFGVITQAWVRVRPRPVYRASASVSFDRFEDGCAAAREIVQAGLWPTNCRLLDAEEATLTGVSADPQSILLLGFESAGEPVEAQIRRTLELCRDHGGRSDGPRLSVQGERQRDEQASSWRNLFLRAPYLRDTFVAGAVLTDTFETAVPWNGLERFVANVRAGVAAALAEVCGAGTVSCRLTHVYPDGAAPYFTVVAPARRGSEVAQWDELKQAASELVLAGGGTITHHHAVGRDHRPWYDRQRPDPFAHALAAAKRAVDPAGVMNPGVLVDADA